MTPPSEPLPILPREYAEAHVREMMTPNDAVLAGQLYRSHESLRARLRVAEADYVAIADLFYSDPVANAVGLLDGIKSALATRDMLRRERDAARSECERLREAIAMDPHFGYEADLTFDGQLNGWFCRDNRCSQREGEPHLDACRFSALAPAPSPLAQATDPRGSGNPGGEAATRVVEAAQRWARDTRRLGHRAALAAEDNLRAIVADYDNDRSGEAQRCACEEHELPGHGALWVKGGKIHGRTQCLPETRRARTHGRGGSVSRPKSIWLVLNKRGHAACLNSELNTVAHESFSAAECHRHTLEEYIPNGKPWRSVRYVPASRRATEAARGTPK